MNTPNTTTKPNDLEQLLSDIVHEKMNFILNKETIAAVRAAVEAEQRAELERLKVQMQNASLAAQEQCERAKALEQRVEELEAELTETRSNYDKYIAKLKEKNDNQRTRINYLEGATHHVGGTPLSRANERISGLERELVNAQREAAEGWATAAFTTISTLKPISEAGPVPDGCVRVYADYNENGDFWLIDGNQDKKTSHCADLHLPTDHLVDANKDEPAWIEHDGGPCPLKDDEVEEWEWQLVGGNCSGVRDVHKNPPSGLSWRNDLGCSKIARYRVLKWKPGYTATTITGPDGKVYTRHKPGDVMPCHGERIVVALLANKEQRKERGVSIRWDNKLTAGYEVIAWRYADEPAKEAAAKPEPFNESKWIWMMEWCRKKGLSPSSSRAWDEAGKQWNNRKLQD